MAVTIDGTTGITTPGLTNTGTETLVDLTTTGNTTIGNVTTDTLVVGVNGIVKDTFGNVGIGTASPSYKLDVYGITRLGTNLSQGNANATDLFANTTLLVSGSGGNYLAFGQSTTGPQAQWIQSAYLNPTTAIYPIALQPLGGNVGIGTYTPGQPLTVSKNYNGATWVQVINTTSGTGASAGLVMTSDASIQAAIELTSSTFNVIPNMLRVRQIGAYPIGFFTTDTERMRIDASGNLGIGETSPVTYANGLTITDTAAQPEISLRTNTTLSSTSALKLGVTSSIPQGGAVISSIVTSVSGQNTDMIFSTIASGTLTAKMRLDANGNFGIGTASPSGKFHVAGTNNSLFTSAAGTSYVNLGNADGVTNTKYTYIAGASGYLLFGRVTDDLATRTETMRIDSLGNVGIGTQSPGVKLDVVGTMRANTSVVAGNSSFGITINQNSLTLAGANSNFIFTKPVPTISNSSRFDFNTGSLNTGILAGPWWNGVHFNAQDVITNASAANEFPRTSHYYSYSTVTNPTDLNYNIVTGNSTVPQHMTIGTATSANIKFLIANAEAMRIDSAGSVGIGIGALSFSTQVTPSLTMYGGNTGLCLRNATTGTGNNVGTDIFLGTNGDLNIDQRSAQAIYIQTTATTRMAITASGDVGINTTTPSKKFEVYTAANSLQIASIVRNENTGTGVAAIGFNVSAAAGSDASVTKAGIGLVRSSTFGRGVLTFYNDNSAANNDFTTANAVMSIDATGVLGFNSGYGSVANAYGCRAWIAWTDNGTAITTRGSGNVTSITRNALSDYTLNFTTAMPDVNYSLSGMGGLNSTSTGIMVQPFNLSPPATGSVRIQSCATDGTLRTVPSGSAFYSVAIFR